MYRVTTLTNKALIRVVKMMLKWTHKTRYDKVGKKSIKKIYSLNLSTLKMYLSAPKPGAQMQYLCNLILHCLFNHNYLFLIKGSVAPTSSPYDVHKSSPMLNNKTCSRFVSLLFWTFYDSLTNLTRS